MSDEQDFLKFSEQIKKSIERELGIKPELISGNLPISGYSTMRRDQFQTVIDRLFKEWEKRSE
jgi:hypothetical protein